MEKTAFPAQRKALGWVLRISGWILRLAGSLAVLGSVQRIKTLSATTNGPGYDGPPSYVLLLVYLGVMIAGAAAFLASLAMGRRARVHTTHIITSVSGLAPGSYVLYLRPFTEDLSSSGIAPAADNNMFNNPVRAIARSGRTYEERLSRTFRQFGPLVAVGRPGEPLPGGSGARRTYLPLDDWKDTVGNLIDGARLIILGAGPGPGTVWEYVEVLRRREPSRLVVLITDPAEYQRFKASTIAEAEGALFELKHKYGNFWQPPILPDLPSPVNPHTTRSFYFRGMIYFTDGWEPHLANFDRSAVGSNKPRKIGKYFAERMHPVMTHISQGTRSPARPPFPSLPRKTPRPPASP
ncbi:hypothetical protein [Streptomyces roseoverticillatus]|uniref:Uncharacterized protein n=1 Tax=Streptomyces roseoverticillatus TaxID=66429 RepID=A0ABV3J1Q9_9ACTN